MTSVLTNTGAMVALESLQATQSALTTTQNQISTGLKISTAKDNAAVWTVATTMKANVASLNQVSTGLGNADSILGTAVAGATQVASLVAQIRAQAVSLSDSASNPTATALNITQLTNQITAVIGSSSFNGINLLNGSQAAALQFTAATANDYTVGGAATTTIATGAAAPTDLSSTGALATLTSALTTAEGLATPGTPLTATGLNTVLAAIDTYSQTVETAASALGATQSNIEGQKTFVDNLSTSLTAGVGNMVDADMTAESARLTALQTQQQLGVSALSIANQAPQAILKLFG
jgi:flagellin